MWNPLPAAAQFLLLAGGLLDQEQPTQPKHDHDLLPGSAAAWATAGDRAAALVANMTLEEKLNVTSGVNGPCQANSGSVPRLGVPSFCYNDGPAGLRHTDFVTQYPSEFTSVMAWDRDLMRELEERIGGEFVGKGVNVELGPLTGGPLGRSPYGGRNWEAFTPDPYLSSQMSGIAIRALQSTGLVACAKHYFLYEQGPVCTGPNDGYGGPTDCQDVSSIVDDKTIKELYLPSFAEAVRAGVGAVMCSYNKINDTPACQNPEAMTRILRDELGFQGYVLSDFGATHSTAESANAGMDQELPGTYWYGKRLKDAVHDGKVSEKRIDEMATRILRPWIASGQADGWKKPSYFWWNLNDEIKVGGHVFRNEHVDPRREDAGAFARRVAEESHVLLKNDDDLLPLSPEIRRIGVFGTDADYPTTVAGCGPDLFCLEGEGKVRHWNGTVTVGGGSGAAYGTYIVPPIEAISLRGRTHGLRVDHVLRDDAAHYGQIRAVARSVQVCIVAVRVFLVEGIDRDDLRLDNGGEELILTVAEACASVVVVIHAGGPVVMEDWIRHPKVKAVIFAGYPGQESGNALANILWGDVNPSGRMAFTLGKSEKDWPKGNIERKKASETKHTRAHFSERLAIDYKWFDVHGIKPRFAFGHGLSYTTFEIGNLTVEERHVPDTDTVQPTNEAHEGDHGLYDGTFVARADVRNTGERRGKEVVQLYMSFPASEGDQPPRHLRGFEKVDLAPGESATVEMPLRKKDMAVWDVKRQTWHVPKGTFTFRAGHSSRKLVTAARVEVGK